MQTSSLLPKSIIQIKKSLTFGQATYEESDLGSKTDIKVKKNQASPKKYLIIKRLVLQVMRIYSFTITHSPLAINGSACLYFTVLFSPLITCLIDTRSLRPIFG